MSNPISLNILADEIRTIYQTGPLRAERLIEDYLDQIFKEFSPTERIDLLEKLTQQFEITLPAAPPDLSLEAKEFSRLFSLLFGENISAMDLSSPVLIEKLAHSLNTIFDTLNQIIRMIHVSLLGKKSDLETIRQFIGSHLEDERQTESLQGYLAQVQDAFLVAHKAFQEATRTKVNEILTELSPQRIESGPMGTLKIGPFRKAECFERYKERFQAFKSWFESGRFMEELLREFEKTCQKIYETERRERNGKKY